MKEEDFEGSLVLERLAAMNLVDEFFDAVDSDDMTEILSLLRQAGIDEDTIEEVMDQIESSTGKH